MRRVPDCRSMHRRQSRELRHPSFVGIVDDDLRGLIGALHLMLRRYRGHRPGDRVWARLNSDSKAIAGVGTGTAPGHTRRWDIVVIDERARPVHLADGHHWTRSSRHHRGDRQHRHPASWKDGEEIPMAPSCTAEGLVPTGRGPVSWLVAMACARHRGIQAGRTWHDHCLASTRMAPSPRSRSPSEHRFPAFRWVTDFGRKSVRPVPAPQGPGSLAALGPGGARLSLTVLD